MREPRTSTVANRDSRSRVRIAALAAAAAALLGVAASGALAGNDPNKLRANLTGAAERPDTGDPNGSGTALVTLKPRVKRICFEITHSRIAKPVAGHIHKGGRRVAGPIAVGLFERAAGAASPIRGCANDVPGGTIAQIRNNPGGFYVNLHNGRYPAGALRGQLKMR